MDFQEKNVQELLDKQLISENQYNQINAYKKLNIFSLHNELLALIYISISVFTAGIGILIYQNIDTIGHQILLFLLFIAIVVSFYFSYKNAPKFQKTYTEFQNPLYSYLILFCIILASIFIGYLQFQYNTFGNHYGLATLVPTIFAFAAAYYFDNKSILSIAITGAAATIGIAVNPKLLLDFDALRIAALGISAISLGVAFIIWNLYCQKINLKKHFSFVFSSFAVHLISIACISNSIEGYWFLYLMVLAGSTYYFLRESHLQKSVSLFVFTIIYGFIGINILLFHFFQNLTFLDQFLGLFFLIIPVYFILSIVGFIKLLKNFKK